MTAELPAYACAFWLHLPESHFAAWAVESSHDWKPTLRSPASQLRCSRMKRVAFTICRLCARDEPWSGRSVVIRTSGGPVPFSIAVHEDDGSASTSPPPPPPPVVSVAPVPPPALSLSSSSPPQPAATSASAATSSAMKATNPRFFNVPPSPRKEPATCGGQYH